MALFLSGCCLLRVGSTGGVGLLAGFGYVQENSRVRPDGHLHHWLGIWLCAGGKMEPGEQGHQDDLRLHHGEVGADANSRATAKGDILKTRAVFAWLGCKMIRVEGRRVLP